MAGTIGLILLLTMVGGFSGVKTDLLREIEQIYDFYNSLKKDVDNSNLATTRLNEKTAEPVEASRIDDVGDKKNVWSVWNTRKLRGKRFKSQDNSNERRNMPATASTKGMRGKRSKVAEKGIGWKVMRSAEEKQKQQKTVPLSNGMNATYLDLFRRAEKLMNDIDLFEKAKRALLKGE